MDSSTAKDSPFLIIAKALESLEIQTEYSGLSLSEAAHWTKHHGINDPTLTDLSQLPFVTIDNPDSKDLDQALLIERHKAGYRVRYALADAAYYVRVGSALFTEALSRGTSFYTPTMAVSMLPTELSEGVVSLNPQVDRRALVFDMTIDADGVVNRTDIVRARIRSQAKLNYAGVQAWLDQESGPTQAYDESLRLLKELGNILIAAAARRGVVRFDRCETQIQVAGTPPSFEATVRKRYDTERYNEQISLMCNMQGAQMLLALSGQSDALQAIYRVHEAPLRKRLKELRSTLEAFALKQEEPQRWQWNPEQTLADYVESLPEQPQHRRRVKSIQRQIMQSQRASQFQIDAGEHHALKAASYARFSSPMREIVGIFTHKELLEALSGHYFNAENDIALRDVVIEAANTAKQTQRRLDKAIEFAALEQMFMRELSTIPAPLHTGTVIGMRRDRLYISLDSMAVDVKVYKDDLDKQYAASYAIDQVQMTSTSESAPDWQLGDEVQLSIISFDKTRRRFVFKLMAKHVQITSPASR